MGYHLNNYAMDPRENPHDTFARFYGFQWPFRPAPVGRSCFKSDQEYRTNVEAQFKTEDTRDAYEDLKDMRGDKVAWTHWEQLDLKIAQLRQMRAELWELERTEAQVARDAVALDMIEVRSFVA